MFCTCDYNSCHGNHITHDNSCEVQDDHRDTSELEELQ